MCGNMLRCQVAFLRSGRYPVASTQEARNDVYHSHAEMLPYMVGLGISQFLWPSHYRIFNFFKQAILERADYVSDYLEIGPGHGLLLENALTTLHGLQKAVAVDISPTSLDLTKDFIEYAIPGDRRVRFILGDIMEVDLGQGFHFITMGEVLEHVDRPTQLLERLRGLLAPDGRIFISTCANCPAIDHVYQFDRIQQIRDLILDAGFKIERELALPVENMSVEKAEISRVTINYCALLMLP
ncbi:class I SAM-dependent methyltransferase [Methylogaea oryzae]|nr:class I SAM-dependent methyltransferase [Methylogaea oryzae]